MDETNDGERATIGTSTGTTKTEATVATMSTEATNAEATRAEATSADARIEETSTDWLTVTLVLGGLLVCFYLLPLLSLLVAGSPRGVLAAIGTPEIVSAASTSLLSALCTTVLACVFGLPLAYWLARTDARWRDGVLAIVLLPLVLPPIVSGMLLLTLFGPNTFLGGVAAGMGVALTRSFAGVVLAQTFVASPFVVVTAKAAFEGVPRRLEDAARTLGTSRLGTVRRVTLPLAAPGIVAGATLAFARAMGEFGATLMLAYYPRTMPVQIWVAFTTAGLERAFPVAAVLVTVSICALALLDALGSNPWE